MRAPRKSNGSRIAERLRLLCIVALLLALTPRDIRAADLSLSFDEPEVAWEGNLPPHRGKLTHHLRTDSLQRRGAAAEHLRFTVTSPDAPVSVEHPLPAARAIDDLLLSVWVRSNQPNVTASLRLVFPHETDPATGQPLTTWVDGTKYTHTRDWQQLTATTLDKQIRERLFLLRTRLKRPDLAARDVYVDRVRLSIAARPGPLDLIIDDLEFGPVVAPRAGTQVVQTATGSDAKSPVEFRSHRLLVEGRPFLPRILPWHGERYETLRAMGLNVAWVPDYERADVLASLRQHGLWAMAAPPRIDEAERNGARTALVSRSRTPLPFTSATRPVLFWYSGTGIGPESKDDLVAWKDQIRSADRSMSRPILADVAGSEKIFSRHVDLLGLSEHFPQRMGSLHDYRTKLVARRGSALPWTLAWTWIDCEPAPQSQAARARVRQTPLFLEPEQIRLQTYAALSAGMRGIGFWKQSSLEDPRSRETMLQISQLCLELQILEPFLAAAHLDGYVPFRIATPNAAVSANPPPSRGGRIGLGRDLVSRSGPTSPLARDLVVRAQLSQALQSGREKPKLEAAVLRHDRGVILLPTWYDSTSQFVPGPMQADAIELTVLGVPAAASAWEVSSTHVRSLPRSAAPGGMKITLRDFDQTAAILVTSDRDLITELQRRVEETASLASWLETELATAKLRRVRAVEEELSGAGHPTPGGAAALRYAESLLQTASASTSRREHHRGRQLARQAGAIVRQVQRTAWELATAAQSDPASSPHTLCYQTLPSHWKLADALREIDRKPDLAAQSVRSLLASGTFEDLATMRAEGNGWVNRPAEVDGLVIRTDLAPSTLPSKPNVGDALTNRYCLRLEALVEPKASPPEVLSEPLIMMTSPSVSVTAGQTVRISGYCRVVIPPARGSKSVTISDSLTESEICLHRTKSEGWQPFTIYRTADRTGPVSVTVALHGIGAVEFDDVRIDTIELPSDE